MEKVLLTRVRMAERFEKQLAKVPRSIRDKVIAWIEFVELLGLGQVRRRPGYHDEPLKGLREGQRSVRMNRSYRLIYRELEGHLEILLLEVNKHDY